jgi:hypothetical protein
MLHLHLTEISPTLIYHYTMDNPSIWSFPNEELTISHLAKHLWNDKEWKRIRTIVHSFHNIKWSNKEDCRLNPLQTLLTKLIQARINTAECIKDHGNTKRWNTHIRVYYAFCNWVIQDAEELIQLKELTFKTNNDNVLL